MPEEKSVKIVVDPTGAASSKRVAEEEIASMLDSIKPVFFTVDMPEVMREDAVAVARAVLKESKTNRDRAQAIKKHFDKNYAPGKWHCMVGTDFGSYVTHETNSFLFFSLGPYYVLIFKA